MANVAGGAQGSSAGSGRYERPVVVEPRREVVEVDETHGTVVYVGEPVPTWAGPNRIDTSGAAPGNVLVADRNGVLRPQPWRGDVTWWVDDRDSVPDEAQPGDMVVLLDGSGDIYEVVA